MWLCGWCWVQAWGLCCIDWLWRTHDICPVMWFIVGLVVITVLYQVSKRG
jgi:hypothetical protein